MDGDETVSSGTCHLVASKWLLAFCLSFPHVYILCNSKVPFSLTGGPLQRCSEHLHSASLSSAHSQDNLLNSTVMLFQGSCRQVRLPQGQEVCRSTSAAHYFVLWHLGIDAGSNGASGSFSWFTQKVSLGKETSNFFSVQLL